MILLGGNRTSSAQFQQFPFVVYTLAGSFCLLNIANFVLLKPCEFLQTIHQPILTNNTPTNPYNQYTNQQMHLNTTNAKYQNSYMFRHRDAILRELWHNGIQPLYSPTRHTSHAPSGRDPFQSHSCRHVYIHTAYRIQTVVSLYRGADKSLARTGRKQATATEDFDFHISYL